MSHENEFAQRLRVLRKRAGLKQEELASLINISTKTVQRWEYGERIPRANELQSLAAALHVTEAELLNGPREEKIEIVLSWDWGEMKEGVLDMEHDEKFTLIVDESGKLGVKGVGTFKTLEDVKAFGARILSELEDGYRFQVERGRIAPATA